MSNLFDDATDLETLIYQAIGAASVCWEKIDSFAGVFDTTQAKKVAEEFKEKLESMMPMLGYATNKQLIMELAARVEVGFIDPHYRTVG